MKLSDIIKGLQTLAPYYTDPEGYHTAAEHDVLYAYPTDRPLSRPDVEKMVALGWFQEEVEIPDGGDFQADHYDPEEGWAAFT